MNKYVHSWPTKIAAIVLAAHQEGLRFSIQNHWSLTCSLLHVLMGNDRSQPGGPQCSMQHPEGLGFRNFLEAANTVRGCVLQEAALQLHLKDSSQRWGKSVSQLSRPLLSEGT